MSDNNYNSIAGDIDTTGDIETTGVINIGGNAFAGGSRGYFQVDDTVNDSGILIFQNDTTNNPIGLQIANNGTGNDIQATNWNIGKSGATSGLDIPVTDLANGTDGELITWDATGAPTTVAVGTANQVLTSNGVGTAPTFQTISGVVGSNLLDHDVTQNVITNSGAEETLFTFSLPANTLGTGDGVRLRITLSNINDNGSASAWVFRLKYGATTVATLSQAIDTNSQATIIECNLFGNGATNAQKGFIEASLTANGAGTDMRTFFASGTATEDSTGVLTLAFTSQGPVAASDQTFEYATLIYLKS